MFGAMDLIPKPPTGGRNQTQARLRGSQRKPYPEPRPMKKTLGLLDGRSRPGHFAIFGRVDQNARTESRRPGFPESSAAHPAEPSKRINFSKSALRPAQESVEYVDPEAVAAPSMSGGDGYCNVLVNGQDAGVALTASGAAMALRQARLQEGSAGWDAALRGASTFVRSNYQGHEERIELRRRIRRRVMDDLKPIHGVMSWSQPMTIRGG